MGRKYQLKKYKNIFRNQEFRIPDLKEHQFAHTNYNVKKKKDPNIFHKGGKKSQQRVIKNQNSIRFLNRSTEAQIQWSHGFKSYRYFICNLEFFVQPNYQTSMMQKKIISDIHHCKKFTSHVLFATKIMKVIFLKNKELNSQWQRSRISETRDS